MRTVAVVFGLLGLAACARAAHPRLPEISLAQSAAPIVTVPTVLVRAIVCPMGTVEVEGDYCPNAQERCLTWVDRHGVASKEAIPDDHDGGRCGEFEFPTTCIGAKVHKHYCIDTYEYPNVKGQVPQSWMTWYDVKNACEAKGERLCTKPEWTFACEGPEMHPLPYGDGYHRDRTSCNIDNDVPDDPTTPIVDHDGTLRFRKLDVMHVASHGSNGGRLLDSLLKPSGSMPGCYSPFGVADMVGNVDEFINNEQGHHWRSRKDNGGKVDRGPFISGLVSGHVFGVRNACRPMTPGHNESFSWYETGGRCCADTTLDAK